MDILYQVNDHVQYWIFPGKKEAKLVEGTLVGIQETGHKTDAYSIKRDHVLQDNVGMSEIDIVSPLNIFGHAPKTNKRKESLSYV